MANETEIRPALTDTEWRTVCKASEAGSESVGLTTYGAVYCEDGSLTKGFAAIEQPMMRHALAALALYGQPFGFTREDIAMVRGGAVAMDERNDTEGRDHLLRLAERIEALLPPTSHATP